MSLLQRKDTAGCAIRTRWAPLEIASPVTSIGSRPGGVEPRLVAPGIYCGSRFLFALNAGLQLPVVLLCTCPWRMYLSFTDRTRNSGLYYFLHSFTFKTLLGLLVRSSFSALLHLHILAQIQQAIQSTPNPACVRSPSSQRCWQLWPPL